MYPSFGKQKHIFVGRRTQLLLTYVGFGPQTEVQITRVCSTVCCPWHGMSMTPPPTVSCQLRFPRSLAFKDGGGVTILFFQSVALFLIILNNFEVIHLCIITVFRDDVTDCCHIPASRLHLHPSTPRCGAMS